MVLGEVWREKIIVHVIRRIERAEKGIVDDGGWLDRFIDFQADERVGAQRPRFFACVLPQRGFAVADHATRLEQRDFAVRPLRLLEQNFNALRWRE
ncbi:hypothetical protein D3C83_28250 [compost metagenome]